MLLNLQAIFSCYKLCVFCVPSPMCAQQIREQKEEVRKKLRERAVPSSAIGRAAGFAGMGASLVFGSMKDSVRALPSFHLCLHMCDSAQAPLAVPPALLA